MYVGSDMDSYKGYNASQYKIICPVGLHGVFMCTWIRMVTFQHHYFFSSCTRVKIFFLSREGMEGNSNSMIDNDDERSFSYQGIPEEDARLISKLLFTWQNSLFKRADNLSKRKGALEQEDLIPLPRRDYGGVLATIFENAWGVSSAKSSGKCFDNDKDIKAGAPWLRRAISHVLESKFVFAGFIKAGESLMFIPCIFSMFTKP